MGWEKIQNMPRIKDAPEERKKQQSDIVQHQDRNKRRKASKTSRRNSAVKSREEQEKIMAKKFLEEWKTMKVNFSGLRKYEKLREKNAS